MASISGTADDDTLYDTTGDDNITGQGGNDLIHVTSGGVDSVYGGDGNDTIYVTFEYGDWYDDPLDSYDPYNIVDGGAGTDTLQIDLSWYPFEDGQSIYAGGAWPFPVYGIERYHITGTQLGSDSLAGAEDQDTLIGLGGADTLYGMGGNDTIIGGDGDDWLIGDHPNGFEGVPGNDTLDGGAGNDQLFGGGGSDVMTGGTGDDIYSVMEVTDSVVENANQGIDTVGTTLTEYSLAASAPNVENLTGYLATGQLLTGSDGDNVISANSGSDTLHGGLGNDTLNGGIGGDAMHGGAGDDSYVVDDAADTVIEATGSGTDLVSTALSHVLAANVENLTLTGAAAINGTGNALANTIIGNAAANVLNGGTGADMMNGGLGNDTFYIDDVGDVAADAPDGGIDRVFASVSHTLDANVERLTLTGSAEIDGTGNALANILTGNSAANLLWGDAGNDRINGGGGADMMVGGHGNDSFFVDNAADSVVETANEGNDRVYASASYTLSDNVEHLVLTGTAISGTGNALNNIITGNGLDNILTGGDGHDTLNGRLGADTMTGGAGLDTYIVDDIGDVVIEGADVGSDLVKSTIDYVLGDNVERLTLIGTAAVNGSGNGLRNTMFGNGASNVLRGEGGIDTISGAGGADHIYGGLGNDRLTGGAGSDNFYFDTALNATFNVDTITDFAAVADTIHLDDSVFAQLSPGALASSAFRIGTVAADADDRIIYDSATGKLYYDADGNGAGAAVQFAQLNVGTSLSAADFFVY